MDRRTHWNDVYRTKPPSHVSWFEADPHMSLDLILSVAPNGGRLIDVGGGASFLVDRLLALGNWQTTVLDVSSQAIERAQARLGDHSKEVKWMTTDITEVTELGAFDIWHDRAVFHFLTAPEERTMHAMMFLFQLIFSTASRARKSGFAQSKGRQPVTVTADHHSGEGGIRTPGTP